MNYFYLELNLQICINYLKFMKYIKITFIFLSLIFLNGCFQSTALIGPGITVATTGNVLQAGFQYGANTAIKKETGKDTFSYLKDVVNGEKKREEQFKMDFKKLVEKRFETTRQKLLKN